MMVRRGPVPNESQPALPAGRRPRSPHIMLRFAAVREAPCEVDRSPGRLAALRRIEG